MDELTQLFLLAGTIYFAINIASSIKYFFYKPFENKNTELLPLLMAILPLILAKKNEVNDEN